MAAGEGGGCGEGRGLSGASGCLPQGGRAVPGRGQLPAMRAKQQVREMLRRAAHRAVPARP